MNREQAIWVCFELGLKKLKLRIWIYRENHEKLAELFNECIELACEKYDESVDDISSVYDKCVLNKYIYFNEDNKSNLNINDTKLTNYHEIVVQPLEYIIFLTMNTSYRIVDSVGGSFLFFQYMYDNYVIFEPLEKTFKYFSENGLYEYIKDKYKNMILYTIHL